MTLQTWLFFCLSVFALCGVPGPNMLQALTTSVQEGFRRSFISSIGCLSASLLVNTLSVLGLGAFLQAEPTWFNLIRYAGAAYLFYLGAVALLTWRQTSVQRAADDDQSGSGTWKNVRRGFLVGVSNPKLILFSVAFFPQFVDRSHDVFPQFVILLMTFALGEVSWLVAYGAGGARLASFLMQPRIMRGFNIASGVVFLLFGVAILSTHL